MCNQEAADDEAAAGWSGRELGRSPTREKLVTQVRDWGRWRNLEAAEAAKQSTSTGRWRWDGGWRTV